MTTLEAFVLVGTVLSYDSYLATISFNFNPATNGGPSIAVLPKEAIPCEIKVGSRIFVVKDKSEDIPTISCEKKLEKG